LAFPGFGPGRVGESSPRAEVKKIGG
jgi:hypothetical protein